MATPIEANRPPNASVCCWLTPASSTVDAGRDAAVGLERVDRRLDATPTRRRCPRSVISAVIARGRRLVDARDAALDVGLLDGRDRARAGPWPRSRPAAAGARRRTSRPSGSTCDDEVDRLAVGSRVTWVDGLGDQRAADLVRRPGRRSARRAIALFGSTVTWISAVALTRSLWRLASVGLVRERVEDGRGRRSRPAAVLGR